jgi:hypothetical protein
MKKLAAVAVLTSGLGLLHPDIARAQMPTAQPWSLGIGGGAFYENNDAGDARRSDIGGTIQANLGRSLSFGPRGSLSLSGNAGEYLYKEATDLNHLAYGVGVTGSYAITQRLSWTITDSVSSSYAQNNQLLIGEGIVLPNVQTISHGLSTHFGYLLTPRMDISASVSSQSVGFDSSIFTGGSNVSTNLALGRKITGSQTLGISHDYSRTFSDSGTGAIQAVVGTWQLSKGRSATNATAGVRFYTQPGGGDYSFSPAGSIGWSWLLSETNSIALNYNNTVAQGFGFDRTQLTQTVSGTYSISHRRLTFGFGGTYSRSTYPLVEDSVLIGEAGSASVRYLFRPKLSVVVDSSVYSTSQAPAPRVSSYRTTVSLAYATTFR